MRAQSKLKKPLHAPTRNRQLTIPPSLAKSKTKQLRAIGTAAISDPCQSVAEIKHRLKAAGAQLPVERFSNAELLRYGHACGLLKAQTADEKAEATEQAVDRVRLTLEWLQGQKAMTPMQVEHWDHLVRWQGRDAEGRPILVVRVAQACLECSSTRAELLGQAILSQVASAVDQMLGDEEGEAEQMVAVLDARQATTLQVTRKVNLIKRLALALNQHYPARLHQLYLVDLPVVLKWVVAAVKPVLHAETRAKIQVCQLPSPVFPFPSTILDFTSPLKRISLPSAAHTSGGQSRCAASAQPGPQSQATPQLVNLRHFRTTAAPFAKKDFYEVLGVAKDASDSDIKKSYYKLAKQYHPDSNKGDDKAQKKFQEVSEAYDTLKDSSKRSMYDQVGPEGMDNMGGFDGSQGGFGGFGGGGFRQATPEEMSNMFINVFGGGGGGAGFAGFADLFAQQQRQAQMRGPDVQAQLRITLREAAEGVKKTLHIPIRSIQGKRETRKVEIDIPAGQR
ncbi:TPA: hypothetical protein ACH3X2_009790 [Trebouxia sp. C0005]